MSEEAKKISVNAKALFRVLSALNGPPHHIKELQATRASYLGLNPINTLTDEYNSWATQQNEVTE